MTAFTDLQQQAQTRWEELLQGDPPLVMVGNATCGRSAGSVQVMEAIQDAAEELEINVEVVEVGCIGLCYAEPLITIFEAGQPGLTYGEVTPREVKKLLKSILIEKDPLADRCLGTLGEGHLDGIPRLMETPVLEHQVRRALKRTGIIDPKDFNHYLAHEGYTGLQTALTLQPEDIVEEIKQSGLRGRGGAGFPTWRKWQFCRDAEGDKKYLICNADEGDPGAFMNRSLMEGDPHALIEGMIISGYALGANQGYIYTRAEYPLALRRLRLAIEQAENHGMLGEDIFGSGFDFHIKIKEGAGAFVCGEETALIQSIEGERGMPIPRPPYPAVSGLWGKPTVINNVETLAWVSLIMQNSADWFAEYGTEKSKGTKTIALVGKVKNTGLVEVPLGISLRTLIYDIGGGIQEDREFKAVQTGGPSGGCIPAELLDTPVDYEALGEAGSIMGSGGVVVMDQSTCMVDFARYFLDFAEKESCGKCVPCRLGTKEMLTILEDLTEGRGRSGDIELLEELGESVVNGSLCGLGQTAPNPVLTTIKYFREEYEAHLEGRCPARSCKSMISFHILDHCIGCGMCLRSCPTGAVSGEPKELHTIDQSICTQCGDCFRVCPIEPNAVEIRTGVEEEVKV